MFIDLCRNNGKKYLRLVNSVRVKNEEGFSTSKKQVVLNIGPLQKYDDGNPEYVARLRQSFKAGRPLIDVLKPYCENVVLPERYNFSFTEGDIACIGEPKIFSNLLLEKIMEELGLRSFFTSYKRHSKIKYNVYSFVKLMVFGRLLNPASKLATLKQANNYYGKVLDKEHNPDNIYDTLTFIANHQDKIIRRMNTNLVNKTGRKSDIIFYDVTNFYYEIEHSDEDVLDAYGNTIEKGMRKNGVCKEKRNQPIVQMGLFMDSNGIPIAIDSFPGNTLDHLTLKPSLSKYIDNIDLAHYILVADRGICNYSNISHLIDNGNGYIMAKSLLKSTVAEQEWAYDDSGFTKDSPNFKYKSRIVSRTIKDEYGITKQIAEKIVIYWSKSFADKAMHENKSFLDFLDRLKDSPSSFRISSLQAKKLRPFIGKNMENLKTGDIIKGSDLRAMLNTEKLEEYKRNFGYYQLVSSELNMSEKDIIDKYHGLSQIENQFRIMKGDLSTRPLYVRDPKHIKAHLLICMIALTLMRIIQNKIVKSGLLPDTDKNNSLWTMGLSGERVQAALNKWQVDQFPDDYFRFLNSYDPDLKLILDAFNIKVLPKFYRRAELKQGFSRPH